MPMLSKLASKSHKGLDVASASDDLDDDVETDGVVSCFTVMRRRYFMGLAVCALAVVEFR